MEVTVKDCFEITNRLAPSSYPAGLVVAFDWSDPDELLPLVGEQVKLMDPQGRSLQPAVGEIKSHGSGRSFYFAGLTKNQGPRGSTVSWTPRPVGPRTVDELGRVIVTQAPAQSVR
jgi:hypothetical protein